jgi:RNA ligase (TIGR02306 family)
MSTLIIEVCKIDDVLPHPNADRLEIIKVKGWAVVAQKGSFAKGEGCVYIPPDSILPKSLSDQLGITKYLTQLPPDENGVKPDFYRVRVAKLRGVPSYGTIMPVFDSTWKIGQDVSEILGITKYEPPLECVDGDAERPHPVFHRYFTLEHYENFPDLFQEGEEVVMTEKIHGMSGRVGIIREAKDDGTPILRFAAGSHDVRRKELQTQRKRRVQYGENGLPVTVSITDEETGEQKEKEVEWFYEETRKSQFWEVLEIRGMKKILLELCNGENNVIIFGELYGTQDMKYGLENGRTVFRVFDISVNGIYLDFDTKFAICHKHMVEMVPVLYRGPFSNKMVYKYVSGPTLLCEPEQAGKFKGREGIVITSVKERQVVTEKKVFERAALKAVSFEYQERRDGTEYH